MHAKYLKLLILFVMGNTLTSCDQKKKRRDSNDDTAIRNGKELAVEELRFYDAKADLSADGQKVVFISGRDDSFRVYLANRAVNVAATRLTDDQSALTNENEASISPDGSWVLFVATGDSGVNLYSRDFAGQNTLTRLTDDTAIEAQITISPDSRLFAFVSRQPYSLGAEIYVGTIDATSGPVASSITKISEDKYDESRPVFISDTGSGYQILSLQRDFQSFDEKILKRTLTVSGSSISASASSEVATAANLKLARDSNFVSIANKLVFVRTNDDNEVASRKPLGAFPYLGKLHVSDRTATFSLDGTGSHTYLQSLGVSDSKLSLSSSGILAMVSRVPSGCEENDVFYQSEFSMIKSLTGTNNTVRLLVKSSKDYQELSATDSPCLSKEDADQFVIDSNVLSAKINADATATNYSIVYSSLLTNDNEVFVFESVAGEISVKNISDNF